MLEEFKHIQSSRKDVKNFGLLVGCVVFVFGLYSLYKSGEMWQLLIPLGAFLVVVGYFFTNLLVPAQKIWMGFAVVMGWIVTHVILSIFFICCIVPFSLITRLFGLRILKTKIDPTVSTYWVMREGQQGERDLEKQF